MTEIRQRKLTCNGISMHVAEAGEGPLVLLCHGWPESWYSWRHQLPALAEAGFHVVAPDMRGYGQTDCPESIDDFSIFHLVGDVVGLTEALGGGNREATIVGHDWGALVAWSAALLRPDRFPSVVGMSVPYIPRMPMRPTEMMKAMAGDRFVYILYFQEPGVAEAEFEADPRRTLRMLLHTASGSAPERSWNPDLPRTARFLDAMVDPEKLPDWLSEADLDFYVSEFERTGFRGGLNWYRNLDRNWELTAPWAGASLASRALFVAGALDPVMQGPEGKGNPMVAMMDGFLPNLAG
ncbi:MAG: alpha/beta hydrolase, partial [Proteobacteria bacterium]|nr:alpha/beta hydrolase [Pseudomonadota bacterium]